MISKRILQSVFMLSLLSAAGAQATYATSCTSGVCSYYGLRAVDGSASPVAPSGDPLDARAAFLLAVSNPSVENFSGFAVGVPLTTAGVTLDIFGGGATLSGNVNGTASFVVLDNQNASPNGRYDTTGSGDRLLESNGTFTITFTDAIRAFGFYGTDIGDFAPTAGSPDLRMELLDASGDVVQNFDVRGSTVNGSLLFFGFTADQDIKSIRVSGGGEDGLGFDDAILAREIEQPNPAPEPASLALGGVALFALGAARRRRR